MYFHIAYMVGSSQGSPTWNSVFGDYVVQNPTWPSRKAIAFHVRKLHGAPDDAQVTIFPIMELTEEQFKAFNS